MPEETHPPTPSPSRHVDDILALIDAVLDNGAPNPTAMQASITEIEVRPNAA